MLRLEGDQWQQADAVDCRTWTFLYRCLLQNPSYFDLNSIHSQAISGTTDVVAEAAGSEGQRQCTASSQVGLGSGTTVVGSGTTIVGNGSATTGSKLELP